MSRDLSLKETGPSYDKNLVWSDNSGQNIRNEVKKSSKIGHDFGVSFYILFDCYLPKLKLFLHPDLRFF